MAFVLEHRFNVRLNNNSSCPCMTAYTHYSLITVSMYLCGEYKRLSSLLTIPRLIDLFTDTAEDPCAVFGCNNDRLSLV